MPSGGKRRGAGRPPGALNKRTIELRENIKRSGLSARDFLSETVQNEALPHATRMQAAIALMPFDFPRMGTIPVPEAPPMIEIDGELVEASPAGTVRTVVINAVPSGWMLDPADGKTLIPMAAGLARIASQPKLQEVPSPDDLDPEDA
jgi:hypothetical protein